MRPRLPDWRFAFGEVHHTRLRPVRHAFRYRAFFVRAPLEQLDQRAGSWLFGVNRSALIGFRREDHGDGGPLRDWVDAMMREAGVVADGRVWLHALPRVLGYAFKPVSFWFCHRRDGALMAVIVEVNNTFGERHCYLLADPLGLPIRADAELRARKAFHVSPFCDVAGGYRFRFLTTAARALARIDYEDGDGPLLLTSQSGRFAPIDAASTARALLAYPLFTVGVIVRIHWQALRLWTRRVPFRSKPSAAPTVVTRGTR